MTGICFKIQKEKKLGKRTDEARCANADTCWSCVLGLFYYSLYFVYVWQVFIAKSLRIWTKYSYHLIIYQHYLTISLTFLKLRKTLGKNEIDQ